jgi:hypothetical protein
MPRTPAATRSAVAARHADLLAGLNFHAPNLAAVLVLNDDHHAATPPAGAPLLIPCLDLGYAISQPSFGLFELTPGPI